MEIRDLAFLVAAASAGNFGRAADALGVSSSTMSRHIGRLEDELGLALFERCGLGVRLTAGGKSVVLQARRAMAEVDAVKRAGSQNGSGEIGEIRMGLRLPPSSAAMVGLLRAWRERYPKVGLRLSEMNNNDLMVALEERRLDVILTTSHAAAPPLVRMPLYDEPLRVAVPAGSRLAARVSVGWEALCDECLWVEGSEDSQIDRDFYASRLGHSAQVRLCAVSSQSLFAMVSAGFGIALAGASQCEGGRADVVFRPMTDPDASMQVSLAWLPGLEDPVVGRFVAFLRDAVQSPCFARS